MTVKLRGSRGGAECMDRVVALLEVLLLTLSLDDPKRGSQSVSGDGVTGWECGGNRHCRMRTLSLGTADGVDPKWRPNRGANGHRAFWKKLGVALPVPFGLNLPKSTMTMIWTLSMSPH